MVTYFGRIKTVTNFVCISATITLVGMWIFIYNLDYDSSVIETKEYFGTNDDVFPVVSLCFNQFFDDTLFGLYGENITSQLYKDFLFGDYYDERMKSINFYDVTMNLADYVLKYEVEFRNGTNGS